MGDFHKAFEDIDTDRCGEITKEDLDAYMKKNNYKPAFVQKWLSLFDVDDSGTITYEEYCDTLGLKPRQEVVTQLAEVKEIRAHGGEFHAHAGAAAAVTTTSEQGASGGASSKTITITREVKTTKQEVILKKETPTVCPPVVTETKKTKKVKVVKKGADSQQGARAVKRHAHDTHGTGGKVLKANDRKTPRNCPLTTGAIMEHSHARMIQRKALHRHMDKGIGGGMGTTKETATEKVTTKTKPMQGDNNNGATREVAICKRPAEYATQERKKRKELRKRPIFSQHKRRLRPSITPGTVLILLTGRHRGKRVIFLKQLDSGLLLVTGPFRLNGCPLRRVHQRYVIATKTKLDICGVNLPDRLTDEYFRRKKKAKEISDEGDIFAANKVQYELAEERKEDQVTVDKDVFGMIKKRDDTKLMVAYLRSMFSLSRKDYPHNMVF